MVNYTQDVNPLKLLLMQISLLVSALNVLRDHLWGCCRGFISWKGRRKGGGASCTPGMPPVPQAGSLRWAVSGVLIASCLSSTYNIK